MRYVLLNLFFLGMLILLISLFSERYGIEGDKSKTNELDYDKIIEICEENADIYNSRRTWGD